MYQDLKDEIVAHMPALRARAYYKTRSRAEADDLVQETLSRALRYLGSFQVGSNLKSWLYKIMDNCQRLEFSKRRDTVEDIDGRFAALLSTPPSQEWRSQWTDVACALLQLTPDAREALLMVAREGLSYEEAASKSDCAVGTLKSRVCRARERLAELTGRTSVSRNGAASPPVSKTHHCPDAPAFREQGLQMNAQRAPMLNPEV